MKAQVLAKAYAWSFMCLCVLFVTGCSDSGDGFNAEASGAIENACLVAATSQRDVCESQCDRLSDDLAQTGCRNICLDNMSTSSRGCSSASALHTPMCASSSCAEDANLCLTQAADTFDTCQFSCGVGNLYCQNRCLAERANDEAGCGFVPATIQPNQLSLPDLPPGVPAVLSATLDETELEVVEAADIRAATHRQREVRLITGDPSAEVAIVQVEHGFRFGVPLDSREFENGDGRLEFYGDIARKHTTLLVAETSLKWRNTERESDVLTYDLADFELAWAESLGFDVKAHVLLWGNAPPLSSGSGTPDWLRERFPDKNLSDEEKGALRALIRERIQTVVSRYGGRIDVWEVTNEMLNPLTSWFIDRLGPEIVEEAFQWAREADPGAELVYNEWISDIFTGLGGPDAVAVRDRVMELTTAGVQIDALGQQGHFAPGLVNVGIDQGLDQRTRVDDYADALETLAETGLPIHITEVTFAAPDDPEERAAQAEAIMRIWWGHPQVEEVIFWNFWNPLGPRSRLDLGLYSEDRSLTRHGEAILSLLNDRWRTRLTTQLDDDGTVTFTGTIGKYVAQWITPDGPVHVQFDVPRGEGRLTIVAVD